MPLLNVLFDVPNVIQVGLNNGIFERYGGVIREVDSKRIVCWLQEGSKDIAISGLTVGMPALNILTLGVTLAGFAFMTYKLSKIQGQLDVIREKTDFLIETTDKLTAMEDSKLIGRLATAIEAGNDALVSRTVTEKNKCIDTSCQDFRGLKNELKVLINLYGENGWDLSCIERYMVLIQCYITAADGYIRSLLYKEEYDRARKSMDECITTVDAWISSMILKFENKYDPRILRYVVPNSKNVGTMHQTIKDALKVIDSRRSYLNLCQEKKIGFKKLEDELRGIEFPKDKEMAYVMV